MPGKPLVSVIIPVYNTEKYLKECLDSVLAQTHENLEVLLVDDGSTDSSLDVCRSYEAADPRIHVMHKSNGGQASARNVALDVFCGDYLAFVDSDDFILPTMIETMLSALLTYEADVAVCGMSSQVGSRLVDAPIRISDDVVDKYRLFEDYVKTPDIKRVVWNKLYKRDVFQSIRFPEGMIYEDSYIVHLTLDACKSAAYVHECLYVQRVRSGSTTQSSFSGRDYGLLKSDQHLMDFYAEHYPALYAFVAAKKINDTAALMGRIVSGFSVGKNKKDYRHLREMLLAEYPAIHRDFPENVNRETVLASEKEALFRLKCRYAGLRHIIGAWVRRIRSGGRT